MHDVKVITASGSAPSERDRSRVDAASFETLYLEHHLAIYRYLRGWGSADEVAADLTAETFERAYRNLDRYRPGEGGPRTWLFRIARNLAIDAA